MTPCYLKLLPNEMVLAIISYLFGIFSVKWSPLWKQSSSSLETLTRLYPDEVWSCLQRNLLHISGYADEDGVGYSREEIESLNTSPASDTMEIEQTESQSEVTEAHTEDLQLRNRFSTRIQLSVKYGSLKVPLSHNYSSSDEILFE